MKILNKILYWSYKIVQVIGGIVLSAILLIITAGIISRYFFNSPISWTEELTTFLMVYLCYISAGLTTVQKKHIVADFFISKAPEKVQKIVSIISRLLMILFFVVVCISIIKLLPTLTWRSGVLEIHRRFYYYPVLVMSIFMIYAVVVDILNEIFPGYDIMAELNKKHDEAEKEFEKTDAAAIEADINKFLNNSVNSEGGNA